MKDLHIVFIAILLILAGIYWWRPGRHEPAHLNTGEQVATTTCSDNGCDATNASFLFPPK